MCIYNDIVLLSNASVLAVSSDFIFYIVGITSWFRAWSKSLHHPRVLLTSLRTRQIVQRDICYDGFDAVEIAMRWVLPARLIRVFTPCFHADAFALSWALNGFTEWIDLHLPCTLVVVHTTSHSSVLAHDIDHNLDNTSFILWNAASRSRWCSPASRISH